MQSNMEKTAAWALRAEEAKDPIERSASAQVAQVYATMVVADRLADLTQVQQGWTPTDEAPRTKWWGDGS